MPGLERVAAVYRLLERVRQAEAMAANAGVAEVESSLSLLAEQQQAVQEQARAGVADGVTRAASERCLASAVVTRKRLRSMWESRVHDQELALRELAESSLRLKQVEEVMLSAQREQDAADSKRVQSESDERYLSQRFRASTAR